ncbi:MAG: hypothetical protein ACREGJ_00185 [Candidatus Saccharimonadales bacterium]
MAVRRQLVIIPGLGDRGWLYCFIKPIWALFGYKVHIFVFGWNDERAAFKEAQNRLNTSIKGLGDEVYLIGVSAGGTAAVNALAAHPTSITKLATVCTPYQQVPGLKNELLAQSINRTARNLAHMDSKTKAKILSVHGLYDQAVPVKYSEPDGIQRKSLLAIGHGLAVALALSVYSRSIRLFLKD